MLPIGIAIFVENFLTIIVLIRSRLLFYRVRLLSINLAITDCLTGLSISLPDAVYTYGNCILQKYTVSTLIFVSLLTVTMINFDRYSAIKYAMKYYKVITERVLIISCIAFWVAGMLLAYMAWYDPTQHFGIFCGLMYQAPVNVTRDAASFLLGFTILLNLFFFVCILNVLRKRRVIHKGTCTTSHAVENCNLDGVTTENINVVKKLSVITGIFLFCITPFIVFKIIVRSLIPKLDYADVVCKTTTILAILNCAINPVLYVWRFTEARYQFKRLLFFWSPNQLRALKIKRDNYFSTYEIATISRARAISTL